MTEASSLRIFPVDFFLEAQCVERTKRIKIQFSTVRNCLRHAKE